MNEEEMGKLAYETYVADHDYRDPEYFEWDEYSDIYKRHWIAVAKAVAERVMAELTTAEEASE